MVKKQVSVNLMLEAKSAIIQSKPVPVMSLAQLLPRVLVFPMRADPSPPVPID